MTLVTFTARDNTQITGELIRQYPAFEGSIRYIIRNNSNGKEYRCVKDDEGKFYELVI